MSNKKPNIVAGNEIGENDVVLTEEDINSMTQPLAPNELPDPFIITNKITEIMEFMCTDEMLKIRDSDSKNFEEVVGDKFQQFKMSYPSIFELVVKGEDLTNLLEMLEKISLIKSNEIKMEDAEEQLKESLAEQYVYPNLTKTQIKKLRKKMKNIKMNDHY